MRINNQFRECLGRFSSIKLDVGSFFQALETDSRSRTQILEFLQAICHIHCPHLTAPSQIVWMNVLLAI